MTTLPTIVADIGGTNTRVALAWNGQVKSETIRRFGNAEHPDIGGVLRTYLAEAGVSGCASACVAVAGPVEAGTARLTNLDWTITEDEVGDSTRAKRVAVINDMQAQGHALAHLAPASLRPVVPARQTNGRSRTVRLVVGVGTGFNAAPVHETPTGILVAASECGHASMPVRSDADLSLMRFVERTHGFADVEDVLSGRGLEAVFAWQAREAGRDGRREAAKIMAAITDGGDAVAEAAGRTFVRLLGTVVGDLALTYLPFAGVYLIGGVARAFTPHLEHFGFAEAMHDKGRFSDFAREFPVFVVEDDYAALTGCARYLRATADA
ncbi:Glucokinase [Defluviimonas aquaemixtae]|uniref:Glucokinase n=1 Tax=Albidovulum aquaemixtae TaxID=1542388 RepID=A0A2R8B5V8_9RHOB|nr:glucokinase [Defluviimonas aquaemixtae]SPH17995.1 Glucokinase [Defluviimonas aquaemixtae]